MASFSLKDGMELGAASAATQIEGGELDHSWADWARRGHVKDGATPARANDHYNRWLEDDRLMAEMGLQIARIGLEWARIEPREGVFDEAAIAHYREEIRWLNAHGIKPLVTLHHFTNPMWFERMGAFEKRGNVQYYLRFVTKVVQAFGADVTEYLTLNEPNIYAWMGYLFGTWPPGKKSFFKANHVMSVLAVAHIQAYQLIHALQKGMGVQDTRVSYANSIHIFAPQNPNRLLDRLGTFLARRSSQESLSAAMMTGVFRWPIRNLGKAAKEMYCDFIALNYYTRTTMEGFRPGARRGVPVNDLQWEIYPQGIVEAARTLHRIVPLPIYITENGTCDNRDAFRSRYVYEHLEALCQSNLPVRRYYHWCFLDNFEWAEGENARFGLVHVDFTSQTRTVKESGRFFAEIIRQGGVSEEMFQAYVEKQRYTMQD